MHQPSELRGSNQGGHLQDGVIFLLRPEHFSLNLEIPARCK